jgi:hypothetical protein
VLPLPSSCTATPFNNTLWLAPALATGAIFTTAVEESHTAPPKKLQSLPPPHAVNSDTKPVITHTFAFLVNALSVSI